MYPLGQYQNRWKFIALMIARAVLDERQRNLPHTVMGNLHTTTHPRRIKSWTAKEKLSPYWVKDVDPLTSQLMFACWFIYIGEWEFCLLLQEDSIARTTLSPHIHTGRRTWVFVIKNSISSKQATLIQHCFNASPTSATLAQRWSSVWIDLHAGVAVVHPFVVTMSDWQSPLNKPQYWKMGEFAGARVTSVVHESLCCSCAGNCRFTQTLPTCHLNGILVILIFSILDTVFAIGHTIPWFSKCACINRLIPHMHTSTLSLIVVIDYEY